MIIQNGLTFTPAFEFEPLTIKTKSGIITEVCASCSIDDDTIFDASGCFVLPGLTDIHFHGCNGYDFSDATQEAFAAIAAFEYSQGITSICPATMTLPDKKISKICENAALFHKLQQTTSTSDSADLIGIHIEGPFINANKKGAQNNAFIHPADSALLYEWQQKAQGLIKLISLAPETENAISCIEQCHNDFHFSIAHTEADYDTALTAFHAGADHVTHLYNAMPPFTHRAPGVIGAAADTPNCFVELICDGVHIAPSVIRATFRLFDKNQIILVSDSMEATGKPDGNYNIGGLCVKVSGNCATLLDNTIAGSVTSLYQCLLTAVSMGIPFADAIRAATINPCRSIGMDHMYGSIEPGKKAHFLILNQTDLSIKAVLKG